MTDCLISTTGIPVLVTRHLYSQAQVIFTHIIHLNGFFTGVGAIIPGGRLNKKDGLTRYGDSHVKDKTS